MGKKKKKKKKKYSVLNPPFFFFFFFYGKDLEVDGGVTTLCGPERKTRTPIQTRVIGLHLLVVSRLDGDKEVVLCLVQHPFGDQSEIVANALSDCGTGSDEPVTEERVSRMMRVARIAGDLDIHNPHLLYAPLNALKDNLLHAIGRFVSKDVLEQF